MMMMIEAMIQANIELEPKLPPMLKEKVKEKNPVKKSKSSLKRPKYFHFPSIILQLIFA